MRRCSRAAATSAATPVTLTAQASRRPSAVSAASTAGVGGGVDHRGVRCEVEARVPTPGGRGRARPGRDRRRRAGQRGAQRPAQLAVGADDKIFFGAIGTTSREPGVRLSSSESSACSSGIGQAMADGLVREVEEGVWSLAAGSSGR